MADEFKSLNTAARLRETIRRIAGNVVEELRPSDRFAVITSVNGATQTVSVLFPDEPANAVTLPARGGPYAVGQTVRVTGKSGARYVDLVMGMIPSFGRRNLLDNSQYAINQRAFGSGAIGLPTYAADRWRLANNGFGGMQAHYTPYSSYSIGIPAGSPRPANIQRWQCATVVASIDPDDFLQQQQHIEGLNIQHLRWGTSSAESLTLSFDAFSGVGTAQTYIAELEAVTAGKRISRAFTLQPATTTHVVLTFPGETSTVPAASSLVGLVLTFFLGAGSNFTGGGSLQTDWGNTANKRAFGITNGLAQTVANTFVATNIQLEPGSVATPLEIRSHQDELRAAMRYLQRFYNSGDSGLIGQAFSANNGIMYQQLLVPMKNGIVLNNSGLAGFRLRLANSGQTPTSATAFTYHSSNVGPSPLPDIYSVAMIVSLALGGGLVAGDATTLVMAAGSWYEHNAEV